MLRSAIDWRCPMRALLAVVVLVSLEAVGHAQATISIGPQGQYLGNGPPGNGPQGQYLGDLIASRIDPTSVSNSFGRTGSRFALHSFHSAYVYLGLPFW